MSKKGFNLLLLALFSCAGIVMTSCASTQSPQESASAPVQESASAPVQESASAPVQESASAPVREAMPEVASASVVASAPVVMNHNSVYFGFNKYGIEDGYRGVVQTNANYLTNNSSSHIQIQGNTDDIGSVEYNLSLGQKRADSVKKALIASGVNHENIEAISYGKLKPKYPNDSEMGRAQNRRADIVYTAKQPKGYSQDSSNELPMVDGTFYDGSVVEGIQ